MRFHFAARNLFALVLFIGSPARSDDGSGGDAFSERAKSDFNSLLRLCKPERMGYWQQRQNEFYAKYDAKFTQLESTREMLGRERNGKELQGFFAFTYLNEIRELQLNESTRLVEDLGRELLHERVTAQLMPAVNELEAQFGAFKGKSQSENLRNSYRQFLDLKRNIARLETEAPIKETYTFQPMSSAFASEPIKTQQYLIHDWHAAFEKVDQLRNQLQPIQDSITAARFFSPKDPVPWLPVATQLTFLLMALPGWIKSYHSDTPLWPVGLLVAVSMLFSIFLVFYSDETVLNILRQSIVPGLFILYWMARKKGWIGRARPAG